ncbi:hypothetical protein TrCOL_g6809 [Triparma columacea]|uniref:Uncharacterized protein n=1 Tax=Triparma columacea TaxID=722753 RepID=A0A9W7FZY1_9STRA|nr:hypothetical protein TrCOL_g6809 [Triparma columacea]
MPSDKADDVDVESPEEHCDPIADTIDDVPLAQEKEVKEVKEESHPTKTAGNQDAARAVPSNDEDAPHPIEKRSINSKGINSSRRQEVKEEDKESHPTKTAGNQDAARAVPSNDEDAPYPIEKRSINSKRSESSRRRSSLTVLLEATVETAGSVLMSIKTFVMQTGVIALAGAVLPLLVTVCLRFYIEDIADTHYGEGRTLIPPVWATTLRDSKGNVTTDTNHNIGNITSVPFELGNRWNYLTPPPGALPPWHLWWNWTIAIVIYLMYFARVVTLHKCSVGGKAAAFVVTLGLILAHGSLWQREYEFHSVRGVWSEDVSSSTTNPMLILIAIAFPAIFASCYFFSEGLGGVKKGAKAMLVLFAVGILESVVQFTLTTYILPEFFFSGTNSFTKALLRLGTPLIIKGLFIECCAMFAPLLSNILETDLHLVSVVLFGPVACASDLIGRLMQSSAESILASIVLELCGTFAEVYTADVLLQGRTNLDDYIITIRWCLGLCGCASSKTTDNKVHSQQSIEKDAKLERRTTFDHETATDKKRHQRMIFCATVMIINTITEASGLVVGSLFWICLNANPSTPGGGGIELSQAMINLVIMLFGELVLSDSVVAYVSHKFSSSLANLKEILSYKYHAARGGLDPNTMYGFDVGSKKYKKFGQGG